MLRQCNQLWSPLGKIANESNYRGMLRHHNIIDEKKENSYNLEGRSLLPLNFFLVHVTHTYFILSHSFFTGYTYSIDFTETNLFHLYIISRYDLLSDALYSEI